MIALFTPHWLISPIKLNITTADVALIRNPSFGLNSRCKALSSGIFQCANFVFNHGNWPIAWKLSWLLMTIGFFLISLTSIFTILSLCRQSLCGKSLHTITGSLQILSGIFVMISTFVYALGWENERISSVCIDMSYFHPGECSLGYSFYAAVLGIALAMVCGVFSLKAEKATLNPSIKRRIEEGNERLIFAR
jgi:LHFPL tetraspan subfamily member protein